MYATIVAKVFTLVSLRLYTKGNTFMLDSSISLYKYYNIQIISIINIFLHRYLTVLTPIRTRLGFITNKHFMNYYYSIDISDFMPIFKGYSCSVKPGSIQAYTTT